MANPLASLREHLKQEIERMKAAHDAGEEIAAYDALLLCQALKRPAPDWVVETITREKMSGIARKKPPKKIGRLARPAERHRQLLFDSMCYLLAKTLYDDSRAVPGLRKLSWYEAYEHAAEQLGVSEKTVRKAISRLKRPRYASWIVAMALNLGPRKSRT